MAAVESSLVQCVLGAGDHYRQVSCLRASRALLTSSGCYRDTGLSCIFASCPAGIDLCHCRFWLQVLTSVTAGFDLCHCNLSQLDNFVNCWNFWISSYGYLTERSIIIIIALLRASIDQEPKNQKTPANSLILTTANRCCRCQAAGKYGILYRQVSTLGVPRECHSLATHSQDTFKGKSCDTAELKPPNGQLD